MSGSITPFPHHRARLQVMAHGRAAVPCALACETAPKPSKPLPTLTAPGQTKRQQCCLSPCQAGCRQQETASKAGRQAGREVTAAFGGCRDVPTTCQETSTPLVEAANSGHGESSVLCALFPWDGRVASVPRWKTLLPPQLGGFSHVALPEHPPLCPHRPRATR